VVAFPPISFGFNSSSRAIQHVGIGKMEAPARSTGTYSCGIFILAIGVGDHLFSEGGAYVAYGAVRHTTISPKSEFQTFKTSPNVHFLKISSLSFRVTLEPRLT
jgi:hypothetical protein